MKGGCFNEKQDFFSDDLSYGRYFYAISRCAAKLRQI
jgi:hypothetical protein